MNVTHTLKNINKRALTNNTQKVAFKLLSAEGDWVSRAELERVARSAAARVRDLRKTQFGQFLVECSSASDLNKRGHKSTFFYRIRPSTVTKQQVSTVFRI